MCSDTSLIEQPLDILGKLRSLQSTWANTRNARGGTWALAGFSFQLANALLALVKSKPEQRQPALLVEALSDIVVNDGGYMVVTQCKLTLGSDALRKALDELWSIDLVACRDVPEIVPKLRYAVLASRTKLADFESVIRAWSPQSTVEADRLSAFRAKLSVRFEPAPWNALTRYLANAFGHTTPLETAAQWLGRLMVHPSAEGMEQTCNEILVELLSIEAAARSNEAKFTLFGFDDLPPDEVVREPDPLKATMAGALPRISDLKQGRFAKRRIYEEISDTVERWLTNQQHGSDGILSSFWITGRSGAGKSVALLHLLADMHVMDPDRVTIPLGQKAHRLPEALSWARPFFADGHQVIIVADDPYAAEQASDVRRAIAAAVRELDSIRVAYPYAPTPAFVFCAPTEQLEAIQDDLSELLSFESYTLRRETKADIEELRLWYQLRTGKTELPIGEAENILIVQLFFEWRTGVPINEFARRFRKRLNNMLGRRSDLFEVIAEILALNRLYAFYPALALEKRLNADVALATAFDRLCQEERHFASDTKAGGYRLTHPHLADAIYTSWFGRPGDRRYRELHLKRGIKAALDAGLNSSSRFAPLWAISRLARGHTDEGAKATGFQTRIALIQQELQQHLSELYAALKGDSGYATLEWLPVWTDLDASLSLSLQPPPLQQIATAVESAQNRVSGLRLACHKLLQHAAALPNGPLVVAARLEQDSDWSEWGAIATHFVLAVGIGVGNIESAICEHVKQKPEHQDTRRLVNACLRKSAGREIVLSWLAAAPQTMPAWPAYYTDFVDVFGQCERGKALGIRFLKTQLDHGSWSHIWERCLSPDAIDVLTLALDWIEGVDPAASGWDRVWERLWELAVREDGSSDALRRIADVAKLRAVGRRWLDLVDADHGSWGFVWAALWKAAGKADNDLKLRGRQWLDHASPDNGSWPYVWKALWASDRADNDLTAQGRQWLDQTSPDHQGWGIVWEALWLASDRADDDLKGHGRQWLNQASPDHQAWGFVWGALWEVSDRADNDLKAQGRQWLDKAESDQGSWGFVWAALWEAAGKADNDLKLRGCQWLDHASPDHGSWQYVWEALWDGAGKADNDLKLRGRQWLDQTSPDHQAWGFVWPALWEAAGKADYDLKARARQWLDRASPDHQGWGIVWEALWLASDRADDDLKGHGRQWLNQASPDHQAWGFVWGALWEVSDRADNDLKVRGRQWLNQAGPDHGAWQYVWTKLWRAGGRVDNDLKAQGRRWLDEASPDHGSWQYVWTELWRAANKVDTDLKLRGRRWLDEAKPYHGSWGYVWAALWDGAGKADNDLKLRGRQWLDGAKPDNRSWRFVWAALWEASQGQDRELRSYGENSLRVYRRGWSYVWELLWSASDAEERAALAQSAARLLESREIPSEWPVVWHILWHESNLETQALANCAERLLSNHPPEGPDHVRISLTTGRNLIP